MKECPACGSPYTDDTLQFCLQDGMRLTAVAAQRLPAPSAAAKPTRRSRTGLVIFVTAVLTVLVFAAGAIAVWLFTRRSAERSDRVNVNLAERTPSPTAAPSSTASPSPSATPTRTPAVDRAAVTREINEAIEAWVADTESFDLESLAGRYADTVEYFRSGGVARSAVVRDKQRAFEQFETIRIRIGDVRVEPSEKGDEATAEFDKEWSFSGERVSEGKVRSRLRFKKTGGRWLITSEKDVKVY
ncbi:MAG: nuclear transport factor 2 family protein [Pyrinomonadaceae bacterium]